MQSKSFSGFKFLFGTSRPQGNCHAARLGCRALFSRQESGGYYIMAPDMPSDTDETNPALRIPENGTTPNYSHITNRLCFRAFIKRALFMESCMDDIEMDENLSERDFDSLIGEIERHLVPLNHSFAVIDHLNTVSHNRFNFPNMADIRSGYLRSRARKTTSPVLYESMKMFDSKRDALNKVQCRIVDKILLEAKLNGLHLGPGDTESMYLAINKVAEEGNKFNKNIIEANKQIEPFLSSPEFIDSVPPDLIKGQKIRESDPVLIYKPILERCSNRNVRKQFWIEYNSRALKRKEERRKHMHSNSVVIENIRTARHQQATLIGFDNYAHLSMTSKMAGSVENVRSFLNTIHAKSSGTVQKSLETLTEFAKQRSKGAVADIELWDIDYYRKDYLENEIGVKDEVVQQYFPLSKVLEGMFNSALRLFQVHIEEAQPGTFEAWNEDVKLFNIVSPAGVSGSFYLDPYQRKGDKLIESSTSARVDFLLPRSSFLSTQPLSCLTLNHCKPILTGEHPCLNFSDVRNLFQLFGSILQFTLTEIPYNEVNGFNFIESDASRITPYFLDLWLLHDYKTISDCSSHSKTKEPLPKELHDKLREANYKFSSLEMSQEVYKSALDLALYSNREFWGDIVNEVWKMYLDPFDRHPDEAQLCFFTEIMTGPSPAAYYSQLWSQMLAAEIFGSFEKVMSDEKKVEELGLRFRDTFLAMGGGVPTSDSFHKFVGQKNPVPDHLLRLHTTTT